MHETAFYKENFGKYSMPVLRALNFLDHCRKKTLYLGPDELIVGEISEIVNERKESYDLIVKALKDITEEETLLVQSGKPVGILPTHKDAPRVIIANSHLVPHWATLENFRDLEDKGLIMYGQMTAGSWIYIGSQGIVQGTYETFVEAGRQHYGGDLAGRWILTAGLGGMGGAQPLAATMAGASMLAVECQPSRIDMRLRTRYLDRLAERKDRLERLSRLTGWQYLCHHTSESAQSALLSISRAMDGTHG